MIKNIAIIIVIAAILVGLIYTAGELVLQGSTGLALIPVAAVLGGIFFYIRKIAK